MKTPLYDKHVSLGGKIVEFAGHLMPIQYLGIIEEHLAVRNSVGLFDVSHMGEIYVEGENATTLIQNIITNDISALKSFGIMYSPICSNDGNTIDDVLIYKFNPQKYLIVVNASNIEKDYNHIRLHATLKNVKVINKSKDFAQLAIQGPNAVKVVEETIKQPLYDLKFFNFIETSINSMKILISRTGYTGEDGFELYMNPLDSIKIWEILLTIGKRYNILPIGLGARDTLRFEACLPLYGHELSQSISPIEAGLLKYVKLYKENFVGNDALMKANESNIKRMLVGFEMIDNGIPRNGYSIIHKGEPIGVVTSGSYAPSLKKNLGIALVDSKYSNIDKEFCVGIRNKELKAKIIKMPFYKKKYKH